MVRWTFIHSIFLIIQVCPTKTICLVQILLYVHIWYAISEQAFKFYFNVHTSCPHFVSLVHVKCQFVKDLVSGNFVSNKTHEVHRKTCLYKYVYLRSYHSIVTRRVPLVEQERLTLQEQKSSPRFLVGFVLLDLYFFMWCFF